MARQRLFMPSRYASEPKTEASAVVRPPVERETFRRRPTDHNEYAARHIAEGLGRMRIAGRHHETPATRRELLEWMEEGIPIDQAIAAYEAGVRDRAAGVRCMCSQCLGQSTGNPYDWRTP